MSEKERNDAKKGENKGKPGHGKRILLRTFGWPMDAVLYDYYSVLEQDLVNCIYQKYKELCQI